jgi:hypothetical protein
VKKTQFKTRMDAHNGATKTTGRMGYGCELRLNAKVTGTAKGSANKMMPIR